MRGVSSEEAALVAEYTASAAVKPRLTMVAVVSCGLGLVLPPLLLLGVALAVASGLTGRRLEKLHSRISGLRRLPTPTPLVPGALVSVLPHYEGRAWSRLVASVTAVDDDQLSGEAEILSEPLGYEKTARLYWQGPVPISRGQCVEFANVDGALCIVGVLGSNPIPGLSTELAEKVKRLQDVVTSQKRVIQSLGELRRAQDDLGRARKEPSGPDRAGDGDA